MIKLMDTVTQKNRIHKSLHKNFNFSYSSFLFQIVEYMKYCNNSFSHHVLVNQREGILCGDLFH